MSIPATKIARVFPTQTNMSPTDEDAYFGLPGFWTPKYDEIHISVTFTWDLGKVERLMQEWSRYGEVKVGGPAYDDRGGEFVPEMYLRKGVTITSRGCPNHCPFCFVPDREGKIRELPTKAGWVIQDNNLLACSKEHIDNVFEMAKRQPLPVSFLGGFEPSRVTEDIVEKLSKIPITCVWLSYDMPKSDEPLRAAVKKLSEVLPRDRIRCYVLIGYENDTLEKAETRLKKAWDTGTLPFAMRYRTPALQWENTYLFKDRAWNLLARQWTRPAITKSICKAR